MAKHLIKLCVISELFKDESKLMTRAENALESGHLASFTFDDALKIVRGKVHASMKDKQYDVEVYFNTNWTIQSVSCSCPRGQYVCHHIGCLLFFARENISVTDQACSWAASKPAKDEVKKVSDIYPPTKEHRSTSRDLTEEEIKTFRNKLSLFEGAVGFSWLLMDNPQSNEAPTLFQDIENILFSNEYLNCTNRQEYLENILKTGSDVIKEVAKTTVGQHKNPQWLLARKNRLTASNFGPILAACRRKRFPPSLFKRVSGTYNMDAIKAIQWGREHELNGIEAFQKTGKTVISTGFWLDECGFIGASPDGLVEEDDAIIEVKCPYRYRETSLLEGIKKDKGYIIVSDIDGHITINTTHDYYAQIQGQLFITKKSKCYLVIWTPEEVITVTIFKEDFLENYKIIKDFFHNHYIPFILGEKYLF